MLKQPAKYKEVTKKVKTLVSDEIFGCDCCGATIDMNDKNARYLGLDVFSQEHDAFESNAERRIFCSWPCALKFIPTISCDYFISLPFVSFDKKGKCSASEFIKLIKTIKF